MSSNKQNNQVDSTQSSANGRGKKSYFDTIGGGASFWLGLMMGVFFVGTTMGFVFLGFGVAGYTFQNNSSGDSNDSNTTPQQQDQEPAGDPNDQNGNGIPDAQEPVIGLEIDDNELSTGVEDDPSFYFVEYGDFSCIVCQQFQPVVKQLISKYSDEAQFIFRHYPNTQIHPLALEEAIAGECAREQGKFWEYKDLVYGDLWEQKQELYDADSEAPTLTDQGIDTLAVNLDLDREEFVACIEGDEALERVQEDFSGSFDLNVQGTPVYYIVLPSGEQIASIGFSSFAGIDAQIQSLLNP